MLAWLSSRRTSTCPCSRCQNHLGSRRLNASSCGGKRLSITCDNSLRLNMQATTAVYHLEVREAVELARNQQMRAVLIALVADGPKRPC